MWDGCVVPADDEYKAWLKRRQIPNFSWSSQGRGFFTDAAGRDKFDNAEIVNSWYSPRNFKRRDRAIELAKELGVAPIQVALAYVLNQPLEVIPLDRAAAPWRAREQPRCDDDHADAMRRSSGSKPDGPYERPNNGRAA